MKEEEEEDAMMGGEDEDPMPTEDPMGAEDEGGIPSNQSWTNIPGALLSDVTNYIGVGGIVKTYQAGKALLGIGKKKVVKKKAKTIRKGY